jgi:peptidoglycan/LPS O-acetylase OafA/YrhL
MKKKLINHIQFLRAISVLLVFFYHLKLEYFQYGFIGVDIFFIISGYVITSKIYNEYYKFRAFNFFEFYKKRFQRIYPVLLFIFSLTFVFIIFFQPLDLFLVNLKVYIAAIFGISNIYYLFSTKDYFDTIFDDPLAHSWSLGIEEQFYCLFPILFIATLKFTKKINKSITIFFFYLVIGLILTYIFSNNTKLVFYSPLFRFWEFLFGSITLMITKKIKINNFLTSVLAFLLIIIITFNGNLFNNVVLVFLISILTSLFIFLYVENKYGKIIFESKILSFIGNISYSFYLWHLPVIYFYDLYFIDTFFRVPFLLILTIGLSSFSYFYIEERFRYKKLNLKFNKKYITLILTSLILFLILCLTTLQKSYDFKLKEILKKFIYSLNYLENSKNYTERTVFYNRSINGKKIYEYCTEIPERKYTLNKASLRIECLKIGESSKRIFYLEGNSHTANFIPIFNSIKFEDTLYYQHISYPIKKIDFKKINLLAEFYEEIIYTTHVDNADQLKELKKVSALFNDKVKILILGPVPNIESNIDPLKCFIKSINCSYNSKNDFKKRELEKFYKNINIIINNQNNIYFYNPYKIICPNVNCYVYNTANNILTHRDSTHLTIEGSLLLKTDFENFYIKNFLK